MKPSKRNIVHLRLTDDEMVQFLWRMESMNTKSVSVALYRMIFGRDR